MSPELWDTFVYIGLASVLPYMVIRQPFWYLIWLVLLYASLNSNVNYQTVAIAYVFYTIVVWNFNRAVNFVGQATGSPRWH